MSFRRTILLTLPLLLSSSVALAQETPSSSTGVTKKDDKKTDTKKKDAKKAEKPNGKAEGGRESTTILGKKVENKDSDLDMSVGQTRTTSAEQPPRPDVIESRAEEVRQVEGKRWSVAPLIGYGTADLKFGLGARAGYTFEGPPVYVGGTFLYHFGNSTNAANGLGVRDADRRFYYPAVEAGYDIGIGPLLVRPYGGFGVLFARTTLTSNGISDTSTDKQLMIYPGATAEYIFPRSPLYVGGDMRVLLPLEGESAAFSLFATAGLTM